MLEDLWTKAIEEYLQIERKDFKVCWFDPTLMAISTISIKDSERMLVLVVEVVVVVGGYSYV